MKMWLHTIMKFKLKSVNSQSRVKSLYDLDFVPDSLYDLDNIPGSQYDLDNIPDNLYDLVYDNPQDLSFSQLSLLLIFDHILPEIIQIEQTKSEKKWGSF